MAGDWHSDLHEEVAADALAALNCTVTRFKWHRYFHSHGSHFKPGSLLLRAQNKFMIGPALWALNRDLIATAEQVLPDIVFIYRGSHITAETLRAIRRVCPDAILIGYNNDDPFSPHYPSWMWRHYKAGLPHYDLVFAYRPGNLPELAAAGARRVELLRSWFVPSRNHPVARGDGPPCDVVFIGHYEDDGRLTYLEEVVRRGHHLRLFGHPEQWNPVLRTSQLLKDLVPVRTVWGENYNRVLNEARVALCFFSRLNRDGYTRRCFEIPASGTLLMSEYSDDLASLYRDGEEAVLFHSIEDFGRKLDFVLRNEARRSEIAQAGRKRVVEDRHDVQSRMEDVLRHAARVKKDRSDDLTPSKADRS